MIDEISRIEAQTTRILEKMWRRRDRLRKLSVSQLSTIVNSIFDPSTGTLYPTSTPPLGGDVTGSIGANTVVKIQNQPVSTTDPTSGQALVWDGAAYVPTSPTPPAADAQGTYLVSGGQVTWQSGYSYLVAAGTGVINGTLYAWAAQTVTLDAADMTYDRIDVIYVDTASLADSITGTAAPNPSEPVVDPGTQLKLALVTLDAGTTEPTVSTELLYAENAGASVEWNWTTSGSGWNVASTSNPRAGTVDIEGTTVATNAYVQGERGSGTIDPTALPQLVLYLRFKAVWDTSRFLQISVRNAGVQVGNALRISDGFFGLDGTNTTTYQAVIIPTLQFAAAPGSTVNQVRIQALGSGGSAIGVYLDDISFTDGGGTGVGAGGLTQDQADARYLLKSLNLTDLESAADARTNLGLNQMTVREIDDDPSVLEPTGLEFPNDTLTEVSPGILRYTPSATTDQLAKVSSNDTTAGYLNGKLTAGTGVTLTENNDGGNETLTIAASGGTSGTSGGDHEHMVDQFSGDGSTTAFELTDEPLDPEAVVAFVAGVETAVTISGTMSTTATFGVAPGAAARVIVSYPAAAA